MRYLKIILVFVALTLVGCSNIKGSNANKDGSSREESDLVSLPSEITSTMNDMSKEDIKASYSLSEIYGVNFASYFSARGHSGHIIPYKSLQEKFPCEVTRRTKNDFYAIYKVTEGGYLYSFFLQEDDYLLSHSIYLKEPLNKKDFKKLKVGDSFVEKVVAIDPGIKEGMNNNAFCNIFTFKDKMYTLHLFDDNLKVIRYSYSDENDINSYKIDKITNFKSRVLTIDTGHYMTDGDYNYNVLAQDYPQ